MFLINQSPANTILRPIVDLLADLTPTQVEEFIREYYNEEWFNSTTPSLRGNDNRLNHRIRSLRAQMGITNWYLQFTEDSVTTVLFLCPKMTVVWYDVIIMCLCYGV